MHNNILFRGIAATGMAVIASAGVAVADPLPVPADPSQGFNFQVKGSEAWLYDTNPLRLTSGAHPISGSDTTAELLLGDYTPIAKLSADTVADEGLYNNSAFNDANLHEVLDASKTTDRWTAELTGHVDYDTARTSSTTTFGVTAPSVRHTGLSLEPQASFNLTAIDKFAIDGVAAQSKYDNPAFTDYTTYSVSPSYARNINPNNAALFIVNAQHYQTENGAPFDVNTIGPSLGWTSVINGNLSIKLSTGVEEATESGQGSSANGSRLDYVFSASMAFKSRQDTANLTATRSEQPFGNGSAALVTSFKADESHALNERLSLNAAAAYSFSNYPAQSGINLDNQITGAAGITYNIIRNIDIGANYQYLGQTLTQSAGSIKEHTVMVALKYHPAIGALW
jgi:hypothetical protein